MNNIIECQVINYLLNTRDSSFITENNISEDYFPNYKKEFAYIKDHINKFGIIPDKSTFLSEFIQFDVLNVSEDKRYLLNELYSNRKTRYVISSFNELRNLLNSERWDDAADFLSKASSNIPSSRSINSIDILKDPSRYDSYVDKMALKDNYYVTTGFKELDDIFGGWDRKEELATIFARSNQGKSWILLKVAIAAAEKGLTVGLYSGEMSETKVGYRADTLISHISNTSIIQGNDSIQLEYKKFIDNLTSGNLIKGSIKVLTPSMLGGLAGVGDLRSFIERDKLDMLCIDQHSLLVDDRHAKNPVEKASNISLDLKSLQVMTHIPIITVSQQNRSDTEDGIDLKNIAQSDRIGQDSTICIAFEQKNNVMTLYIVKSRDSVAGTKLQYNIDLDKGIFEYKPSENDATGGSDCNKLYEEFEKEEDVF